MIVKPTVNELLEHADNRYALVVATSRRARQIANGDEKLTEVDEVSPVTVAANEINEGKVKIYEENEEIEDIEAENVIEDLEENLENEVNENEVTEVEENEE